MKEVIFNTLNIEKKESTIVLLLFIQSVFIGFFYGSLDIGSYTLFLTRFDETFLPKAYILSGFCGVFLTFTYSFLQNRIRFSRLIMVSLAIISTIIFILRFKYVEDTENHSIIFIIFILYGPFNSTINVIFWGLVGRLFTLRQGKRLFGIISAGQIFGTIIVSYAIPLLPASIDTIDLVFISASSVIAALIIQTFIAFHYKVDQSTDEDVEDLVKTKKVVKTQVSFAGFFRNKYIFFMAAFVIFSMIITFFVAYSFFTVSKDKYPDEMALKSFLGIFIGTTMIFGFIIKSFVYSKIMKTYGLRISLLILPILLLLFTSAAIFFGSFWAYSSTGNSLIGSELQPSKFFFFFLIIALCRMLSMSIRDSIEIPSFKTLYQSLDRKIRHDVQAKIDGIVNESSVVLAGLLQAAVIFIVKDNVIYFSFFVFVVIIIWFIIINNLYSHYKQSLEISVSNYTPGKDIATIHREEIIELITNDIDADDIKRIIYSLKILRLVKPVEYEDKLISLINHSDRDLREYVIQNIKKYYVVIAKDALQQHLEFEKDELLIMSANEIIKQFNEFSIIDFKKLAKSNSIEERIFAAKEIGYSKDDKKQAYLNLLMKDFVPQVVGASIIASAQFKNKQMAPLLVEHLFNNKFLNSAASAIIETGEPALDYLEQMFNRSRIDTRIQKRIAYLMGEIGGEEAINFLKNKIVLINRELNVEIIKALKKCKFRATEEDIIWQLEQLLKQNVGIIAWNINAILNFNADLGGMLVLESLKKELEYNYNVLFLILSLLYDDRIISNVKDNIEIGTTESTGFAIELLDLCLKDELKTYILPVLEDHSDNERIRLLQEIFPLEQMETLDVLISIINKDANSVSSWTKACSIEALRNFSNYTIDENIIAQIFSPDVLVRETTGNFIYSLNKSIYNKCSARVDKKVLNDMTNILVYSTNRKDLLLYNRIILLKKIKVFRKLSEQFLVDLAYKTEVIYGQDTKEILYTAKDDSSLFIFKQGYFQIVSNNEIIKEISTIGLFSFCMLPRFDFDNVKILIDLKSICYKVNTLNFSELLFDYPDFLEIIKSNNLML